jgi:peptidyl-prolyl cis-trans isomerase C
VVVRSEATDADDKKARAHALAEALRAAVLLVAARAATLVPLPGAPPSNARIAPADDPDPLSGAFRQAVAAVPTDGLQVVAEPLPPVAEDGHVLVPGDEWFDTEFTRAAAALPARGAVSPLISSRFGLHVIMLLERTPPVVIQGEARAAKLRDDIVNERARAAEKRLLDGLKGHGSVAPDAQGLLGLVGVDP